VLIHYPSEIFGLIFDVVLDGKGVSRRRAGEEGEDRKGPRGDGRKICLHQGDDRGDVQSDRRLDHLDRYVGRGAERTVRVGEIPIRMNVYRLDSSAGNDQRNAQESQEKFPGTLACRIGAVVSHPILTISQEIADRK
jgi:hypothetical protein